MANQTKRKTNKQVNAIVERFNKQFPVGSKVMWRGVGNTAYPFAAHRVAHRAENHHGNAVAWLESKSGFVSVEPDFVDYDYKPDEK